MEKFVKGDIVVVPFPFSDLSSSKKRPALVVTGAVGEDILLAQITSQINLNNLSIKIMDTDFKNGSLPTKSYIKINRLFSADTKTIKYKVCQLKKHKINHVEEKLINFIKR